MLDIVDREIEMLELKLMNNAMHKDKANNFIDKYHYNDEFSGNEILEMQRMFLDKAKRLLVANCKGEYAIQVSTFCVHIISLEFLKQKGLDKNRWKVC